VRACLSTAFHHNCTFFKSIHVVAKDLRSNEYHGINHRGGGVGVNGSVIEHNKESAVYCNYASGDDVPKIALRDCHITGPKSGQVEVLIDIGEAEAAIERCSTDESTFKRFLKVEVPNGSKKLNLCWVTVDLEAHLLRPATRQIYFQTPERGKIRRIACRPR